MKFNLHLYNNDGVLTTHTDIQLIQNSAILRNSTGFNYLEPRSLVNVTELQVPSSVQNQYKYKTIDRWDTVCAAILSQTGQLFIRSNNGDSYIYKHTLMVSTNQVDVFAFEI